GRPSANTPRRYRPRCSRSCCRGWSKSKPSRSLHRSGASMPDSLPKAPALIVRSLLANNWVATNAAGLSPANDPRTAAGLSMNRGWFNSVRYPLHVAIRSTSGEDTLGGGDSGYSGIDPSGAGPTQTKLGDLDVTIFAEGDADYGTGADTFNAEAIRD